MVKNYAYILLLFLFVASDVIRSQEIKVFTISDFDLKGKVKSCLVSTNYGKEEYDFNSEGQLTKSVTRYNDNDYSITYYKYGNVGLLEKRFENYRDNIFDENTSLAHFYEVDTSSAKKITEKIISYNKEFIDLYEYYYDGSGQLQKIIRSNQEGTDETEVSYDVKDNTKTTLYTTNSEKEKEVSELIEKKNDSMVRKTISTQVFVNQAPSWKSREDYDGLGRLLSSKRFDFNPKKGKLEESENISYTYNDEGILTRSESKSGKNMDIKEYIYQFDVEGNWIKEIITPDNAYKTRKIKYYAEEAVQK